MAQGRRQLAEKLLTLQLKISDDLTRIEDCKEALRAYSEEIGEGFVEEITGLGAVEVKAGQKAKFKGILPVLKPEAFLALSERRREALVEGGIVAMEQQQTRGSRPSVTVRI